MDVLVIDDDRAVRTSIRLLLRSKGFDITEAETGILGIEAAKKLPGIALVIIDLFMPEMEGNAAIPELRRLLPTVPIIVLTGSVSLDGPQSIDEFNMVTALGATHLMRKPFRPEELIATVHKALGL
jgi:CheY-like chemotaxis protein